MSKTILYGRESPVPLLSEREMLVITLLCNFSEVASKVAQKGCNLNNKFSCGERLRCLLQIFETNLT